MGVANDGQAMAACMDYQANHVKCTEAAGSVSLRKKCANHHANVVWQESIVPLSVHAEVNATGTTPQLDFTL